MIVSRWMLAVVVATTLVNSARGADGDSSAPTEWPNEISRANSDAWLVENHDRITVLRPRLLVINFANGKSDEAVLTKVNRAIEVFRESSRHHGYKDDAARPALEYEVEKLVNLADAIDPRPQDQRWEGNGTRYPRIADAHVGQTRRMYNNFRYEALFSNAFAAHYGYRDPSDPGRYLTLADLVNRGIINEVWLVAFHGKFGNPFEGVELKQDYDGEFCKLDGKYRQAGNGASRQQPWIGRSLRIMFMNIDRGPGCFLESYGHCIERLGVSRAIPYFSRYFNEFANLDWNERYGLTTRGLYGHSDDPIEYPDPSTITFKRNNKPFRIENYDARGGNVHFCPTARRDYDLKNTQQVYSSIEHYRLFDGPDGQDIKELWDISRFARYRQFGRDCQGPWLVYWYQNFPGPGSLAKGDDGKPMKNWWPFLFY